MKTLLTLLLSSVTLLAQAQAKVDLIPAEQTDIKVQPITHGSLILEWTGEVIYIDPYGGSALYAGQKAPTMILITDIHGDHLNVETLEAIETEKAKFVVP